MSGQFIVDGDSLLFEPLFGDREVTILEPTIIRGNGHATIQGKKMVILGDEKEVEFEAEYITPEHPIPGMGIVTIAELDNSQQANFCRTPITAIVVGQQFTARFIPNILADNPETGPDVPEPSMGRGIFITSQYIVSTG
ncbi:hypothetical protein [Xenorhabdus ishibashii]|uniref:Uncharacterized protein n=1 Tax=Xenorhabdus ishibashii TaxID=1034471 RepID=A0A2D0KAY4_9GAMM|nr:hypothetical protein [Xenorhabdus ishibashii]PHM60367.1 hypothetical protein Xish_03514 [Xenorhabdus ishibashii]